MSLPLVEQPTFAPPHNSLPVYRDNRGRKVSCATWFQQPRKWPEAHWRKAAANPYWRMEYANAWIANREAYGLPAEVHDRIWFKKPSASVLKAHAKKKARNA